MSFTDDEIRGVRVPRWVPDGAGGPANFGDEIGPAIVAALSGDAVATRPGRLLSVGSVLQFARGGDVVWGAGINGKVRQRLHYPLDVRAVRGPLTRAVLLGFGVAAPPVYGDPALLFPRLFPDVRPVASAGVVVVPNLNEADRFGDEGVLSPLGDPFEIAPRIAGAEFVVASSLHALILADAYGVPSRAVVPRAEHAFKYVDYYAGTGRADVAFAQTVDEAIRLGPVPAAEVDLDALEAAFPSDMWSAVPATAPAADSADYVELRRASRRALDDLTMRAGWEAPDPAAQALLRATLLVARQPRELTELLEACADPRSTRADVVAAADAHLATSEARRDLDSRVARALARALAGEPDDDASVAARVAATGRLRLARAIARGEATASAGRAVLPAAPRRPRVRWPRRAARG
ncbi:polysaccharide pyruvyl transferase family protein [Microbacterium excoecariae]|uniref:polysaccharide pyruvyl transferase family protein n=1 Tax=Microbacterium excoecariae TaxID=2715210 RepID=UPI001407C197|nr:polysaccharide pyruvyl transferase family protein [Microbacterium excoecariae]